MKALTIGQVARQAGIGVETVRFYEREGLIEEPDRRASGYRQFEEAAVDRLRFIREAKELGFSSPTGLKETPAVVTICSANRVERNQETPCFVPWRKIPGSSGGR